jgi:hypothetical protein
MFASSRPNNLENNMTWEGRGKQRKSDDNKKVWSGVT